MGRGSVFGQKRTLARDSTLTLYAKAATGMSRSAHALPIWELQQAYVRV